MPAIKMKDPSGIGAKLRQLIRANGHTVITAAAALKISTTSLYETCTETQGLSPTVAARLPRIGIDGRALFLEQAANKLKRYEAKEALIQDANRRLARTG